MIFVLNNLSSDKKGQKSSSYREESINTKNISNPEEWVERHGDYLFRVALIRVQSKQLAEDMIQETFLAALKAYDSFHGKSSERTWLVSILKRKIIDHYRKNSRFVSIQNENSLGTLPDFVGEGERKGRWNESMAPLDWGKNPLNSLEQSELRDVLQKCIASLKENLAAIFVLREIEDKNTEEICKELNISASNVWVMLHRARTQLRRCLEINWFSSK
ncbi:MAG: sigma-70 family RNA polymerase sigma factor [Calditrichia bacterium]|nr:sigma-70 family RNA polymerase sigma factor [Calditrichia bacterium]